LFAVEPGAAVRSALHFALRRKSDRMLTSWSCNALDIDGNYQKKAATTDHLQPMKSHRSSADYKNNQLGTKCIYLGQRLSGFIIGCLWECNR